MAPVAALVVAVDQLTKATYIGPVNSAAPFTEGHGSQPAAQIGVALVLLAVVVWVFRRPWWALGLAVGGVASNLIDRALLGGVRDPIAWGPYWWNVADAASAVGLAVCVVCFVGARSLSSERG